MAKNIFFFLPTRHIGIRERVPDRGQLQRFLKMLIAIFYKQFCFKLYKISLFLFAATCDCYLCFHVSISVAAQLGGSP